MLSNINAGVGEEVLFRGMLLFALLKAAGKSAALVIATVLFSVMHLFVPGASQTPWLIFAVLLSLPGLLLGVAFLRSRALWLPIGIHFTWDLAYDLFNLSGGTHPGLFGLLTCQTGPVWFVGTGFGVEVGLGGILVAVLVWAGMWHWMRSHLRQQANPTWSG